MSPDGPYRCSLCGNRTRFDVFETVRRRRYLHLSLGGEGQTEEEEILERRVEKVVCRYCERADGVERPDGNGDARA